MLMQTHQVIIAAPIDAAAAAAAAAP